MTWGRTRIRGLAGLLLMVALAAAPAPRAMAEGWLRPADAKTLKAAFEAMDDDKWKRVAALEAKLDDPVAAKLVRWHRLTRPGTEASFDTIADFIIVNPHWPYQARLRRRAEETMGPEMPPQDIIAWFAGREPVAVDGRIRLGEALLAKGNKEAARKVLREAWINGDFGRSQEKIFYRRHRHLLTYDDHLKRLDRLLWEGRFGSSRRMLWKVKGVERKLGKARFMLRHMRGNVDAAIAEIPKEARFDAGLIYERIKWRRRKGKTESAIELLWDLPDDLERPDLWWRERSILARHALEKGWISEAYRIAADHRMTPGGYEYAAAEWLAGWIALRFLQEPEPALEHFQRLYRAVNYPISRARGAYWAGRAAEALGKTDWAGLWYRAAGHHPTTYYGQLALARLHPGRSLHLPEEPLPGNEDSGDFVGEELVRAVRLLAETGQHDRLRPFLMALSDRKPDSRGWQMLTATLARRVDRTDLAVRVAKRAGLDGTVYGQTAYPLPELPPISDGKARTLAQRVEEPLVLAIIRQESLFDAEARSRAGARGLMQLMPRTAHRLARKLDLPYSRGRLTDPEYNLTLGRAYLGHVLDKFDGSYVLAIAAYNAGPSRARAWIREFGDPRTDEVEAIDWVEMIPFTETRNYVQRVLENLQVYRARLKGTEVALALERDLGR